MYEIDKKVQPTKVHGDDVAPHIARSRWTIPPEMLEELRLGPGAEVEVSSEGSSIHIRRVEAGPSDDLIEFAHRFTKKYEEALKNLAQR